MDNILKDINDKNFKIVSFENTPSKRYVLKIVTDSGDVTNQIRKNLDNMGTIYVHEGILNTNRFITRGGIIDVIYAPLIFKSENMLSENMLSEKFLPYLNQFNNFPKKITSYENKVNIYLIANNRNPSPELLEKIKRLNITDNDIVVVFNHAQPKMIENFPHIDYACYRNTCQKCNWFPRCLFKGRNKSKITKSI